MKADRPKFPETGAPETQQPVLDLADLLILSRTGSIHGTPVTALREPAAYPRGYQHRPYRWRRQEAYVSQHDSRDG